MLGIDILPSPITDLARLSYYLQDAFEFHRAEIGKSPLILAIERRPETPSPAQLKAQLELAGAALSPVDRPLIVYVTEALRSWERERLIRQGVAFIVPGNQLFLPPLGLDLREYFRSPEPAAATVLRPASQAVLLGHLLDPQPLAERAIGQLAAKLAYTAMTATRARQDLVAAGLLEVHRIGRNSRSAFVGTPREIWTKAQPLLRSPVTKRVRIPRNLPLVVRAARLAGLTALAELTPLVPPHVPIYAVGAAGSMAVRAALTVAKDGPASEESAIDCEIWSYDPTRLSTGPTVDPLSLILSLRDESDERVQLAVRDLENQLPW